MRWEQGGERCEESRKTPGPVAEDYTAAVAAAAPKGVVVEYVGFGDASDERRLYLEI